MEAAELNSRLPAARYDTVATQRMTRGTTAREIDCICTVWLLIVRANHENRQSGPRESPPMPKKRSVEQTGECKEVRILRKPVADHNDVVPCLPSAR
jgi:hypothetical protein